MCARRRYAIDPHLPLRAQSVFGLEDEMIDVDAGRRGGREDGLEAGSFPHGRAEAAREHGCECGGAAGHRRIAQRVHRIAPIVRQVAAERGLHVVRAFCDGARSAGGDPRERRAIPVLAFQLRGVAPLRVIDRDDADRFASRRPADHFTERRQHDGEQRDTMGRSRPLQRAPIVEPHGETA